MNNQILKSLCIKNFRSYKNAYIEFHPGVNAVIGANDSGKSNLLRAINLVAQNQPDGDDYISDWGSDMDIQLEVGNKIVSRFRNVVWNKKEKKHKAGTDNLYSLSGEKEPFRSFGRGKVPDIIKEYLNISSLNINFQLDSPFLLGKNPADVAKHYNELVNLEVIDRTISNIASALRKERSELKVEQALAEKKTEELKEFDWLPNAEKDLSKLEKLNNYLKKLNTDWSDLACLIKSFERLEKQNQELSEITKHEKSVNDLIHKEAEIKIISADQADLTLLISDIKSLKNEDKKLKKIIRYQEKVDSLIKTAKQINKDIERENELRKCIEQLKQYQRTEKQYKTIIKYADKIDALLDLDGEIEEEINKFNQLQDLIKKQIKLNQEQNILTDKLKKLESEFEELMPEICPLCMRNCKCKRIRNNP